MKRNYLFVVAMLFVIAATFLISATHLLEAPKRKPSYAPKKVERVLPHFAP